MKKNIPVIILAVLAISMLVLTGCQEDFSPVQSSKPQSIMNTVMLPAGSTVTSAVFSLYVNEISATGLLVDVHRMTSMWDEATATWIHSQTGVQWLTLGGGGDFDPTPVGHITPDAYGYKSVDITPLVQGWLNGTFPNNGILLKQSVGRVWYFSSEAALECRPKLDITYTLADGGTQTVTIQRTGDSGDVLDTEIVNLPGYEDAPGGDVVILNTRKVDTLEKRCLFWFDIDKEQEQEGPGTGTPGYWMNHPEAWPVNSITIGGFTLTREQAIFFMQAAVKKDKTYTMFPALVAAKLNVMIGNNGSCVASTIASADSWMSDYPLGSGVTGSSPAWQMGETYYLILDAYNNGEMCAPHRD